MQAGQAAGQQKTVNVKVHEAAQKGNLRDLVALVARDAFCVNEVGSNQVCYSFLHDVTVLMCSASSISAPKGIVG
jgi:hypothetical protein